VLVCSGAATRVVQRGDEAGGGVGCEDGQVRG
jgi:hypothetical protein